MFKLVVFIYLLPETDSMLHVALIISTVLSSLFLLLISLISISKLIIKSFLVPTNNCDNTIVFSWVLSNN